MIVPTMLHNWRAKRAGGRITIEHASGKITGVDEILIENGQTVAVINRADGSRMATFILAPQTLPSRPGADQLGT